MTHGSWPPAWWLAVGPGNATLWRAVEAQHVVATMRLVDTLAEQEALESIIEASKPPTVARSQHDLVTTPFRYRSPHATRFRAADQRGIWYGAESIKTACAEIAHWRWRFLMDSVGLRERELLSEHTVFAADAAGNRLDLTAAPWLEAHGDWTSDDYARCHQLATAARERGVQWIRYDSARDPQGTCGAVLAPACLTLRSLSEQQTWVCKVTPARALLRRQSGDVDELEVVFAG